jgi:hypothetical protein
LCELLRCHAVTQSHHRTYCILSVFSDYSGVTPNFLLCMEIRRVKFADYSGITPKTKFYNEMRFDAVFYQVPSCVRAPSNVSAESRTSGTSFQGGKSSRVRISFRTLSACRRAARACRFDAFFPGYRNWTAYRLNDTAPGRSRPIEES